MDMTPRLAADTRIIRSYGPEGMRVGTEPALHAFPLLLSEQGVQALPPATLNDLLTKALVSLPPTIELLLVGTGATMQPIPEPCRTAARARRLMLEAMDTGAACRTYNVLLAEGRRVALVAV